MEIGNNVSYTCFGSGLGLEFYVVHNGVDMTRTMRQPSTSSYHSPQGIDFGDQFMRQRMPLCRRAWPKTSPHLFCHMKKGFEGMPFWNNTSTHVQIAPDKGEKKKEEPP